MSHWISLCGAAQILGLVGRSVLGNKSQASASSCRIERGPEPNILAPTVRHAREPRDWTESCIDVETLGRGVLLAYFVHRLLWPQLISERVGTAAKAEFWLLPCSK